MKKRELAKELHKALSLVKASGADVHQLNQIRCILQRCLSDDPQECKHCEHCIVNDLFQRALPYLTKKLKKDD